MTHSYPTLRAADLPDEYQKKKMPDRSTQRSVSEADMEIEWTRMLPKSSYKPHGLNLGKFFTDCGWMGVTRGGRRELHFKLDVTRSSGGHLEDRKTVGWGTSVGGVVYAGGGS